MVNDQMRAQWCKWTDEYEWVNHYILFQEVHWIIDWPVLYFDVIYFENIPFQFIEIKKKSYMKSCLVKFIRCVPKYNSCQLTSKQMLLVNPMCNICDFLRLDAKWNDVQVVKCLLNEIFLISYNDLEIVNHHLLCNVINFTFILKISCSTR